ncbi:PREDICTED: scarecrow-like protein 3 isoform X1 [Lupinus angustifolius]|uniref:scarecrow-like protein 3 isoform X1 n=1 Tax=Lupinus angustifolius TaxID=3871 RepID=UPI00092F2E53|nr:PREDICTED: scarecrow-like protein 3 isoform X1 [Lupinus angustifolius]
MGSSSIFQEEGSSSVTSSSPLQFFSMMSLSPSIDSPYTWLREMKSEERGLCLIHLLLTCANHVAAGSLENANITLEQISQLASPDGDTMQRIAAYFTEALADRMLKAWPGLHRALNSTKMVMVSEEIIVKKLFLELFPFLKVAYILTNQAIVEAMEGEKMVHIVDLNATEPMQWIALLQVLSARPEGPPHLRITGVHQHKEILDQMAHKLTEEAEKLDIPFQFNPVVSKLENLDFDKLRVKTGEALAISSSLQLHSLLALDDEALRRKSPLLSKNSLQKALMVNGYSPSPDSASSSPVSLHASINSESFLNALWGLSPKVMVVTEQDFNHNSSTLMERLLESLYSYAALFDCLESTISRASLERFKVEKMLFGEEIKNIIACEGAERKERHEKLDKWFQRLDSSGFGNMPLSYFGMLQARRFLQTYGCEGYRMKEENGCVVICWQDRSLFSISAWRSRK